MRFVPALCLFLAAPALAEPPPRVSARLPPAALGPEIDPSLGYAITEIAEGIHVVTDGIYQAMFAVTEDGTIVFDAPPSIGANLSAAIAATTNVPVTHMIYSHSHIDHIGAADQFAEIEIVASRTTAEKLMRLDDAGRPDPTLVFDEVHEMTIGGLVIDMVAGGDGHEPGNLFVDLPQHRVLMAVDIAFPGWVPFTNLGMAEDVGLYAGHFEELLAYLFDHFVAGHCTEEMLAAWVGEFGGAKISTPGHCWIMAEYLNIKGRPEMGRAER